MLPKNFSDSLEKIISYIATTFLFCFLIAVVLQVFTRYVLQSPLRWSEQAARYLNMYAMFLGAALVTKNRKQLGVDMIYAFLGRFPEKVRLAYPIFINLIIALILPGLIYGSFYMVRDQWSVPLTTMPFVSLGQMYLSLFVSSCLMLLYTVDHIVTDIRGLLTKNDKTRASV